jgi:hypothetical protein
VGRPVRLRPRRRRGALPPGARRPVRGRAGHTRGHRRPGLRGSARELPGRRGHHHARARVRGREPHAPRHRLVRAVAARGHRGLLCRRAAAAAHPLDASSATAGPDGQGAVVYNGTCRRRKR